MKRLLIEIKIYQTGLESLHIDLKNLKSLSKEEIIKLLKQAIKSYKKL